MAEDKYETHEYDVVVIGAGGAGLRAAVEASAQGVKTALVCKSLLGKAHTVMAEGGIAAAMGNVYPEDNWRVHFRDTMRGGKLLNNWRMAQIHAQEAPDRVLELEEWGALFDRTKEGLILQRDFGGHRYARLAHVGDRTGLEMIRTLQQHAVHKGIDVYMECNLQRLLTDGGRISGAFGYWRESGKFILFKCKAVVLATGGGGKAWKVTSNSWEYTGDGVTMALDAGADLMDMEFIQFHPTGMVWPPSVRGILVTEGVRGDGGTLKNTEGKRFMFGYIPEFFKAETADTEKEADAWYDDKRNNRRTPDLLPRDEVARAINSEVKAGRGTPHGGVFLDIASRRPADYIQRRLPSMYHQFKELADVISPKNQWKSARPAITRWAASESMPIARQRRCRDYLPLAKSLRGSTVPIGSVATRFRICWCSAGARVSTPLNTRNPLAARFPSITISSINTPTISWHRLRPLARKTRTRSTPICNNACRSSSASFASSPS